MARHDKYLSYFVWSMTPHVPFVASQESSSTGKVYGFDTLVWDKSFLYDVQDKRHGNKDIVQKMLEVSGRR
jgi:hypothetical protein